MTIEITPELIAICVSFVGILIGLFTLGKLVLKVGRWIQGINGRLENLESGQQQILSALQNHVHSPVPYGQQPLFFAPVQQPNPPHIAMPGDAPAPVHQEESSV